MTKGKVLLAYSGGLDTSCILAWLVEQGYEVYCFSANVGQVGEDFEVMEKKALSGGAKGFYVEDLQEEFINEFIYPAIQMNALYEKRYLLGTSLARPVIARSQIRLAKKLGCDYVSHGATGKGNDQVRFELGFYSLNPKIKVIAPWRNDTFLKKFKSRDDLLKYAELKKIPINSQSKKEKPFSTDENLCHISFEGGVLEDPENSGPESTFKFSANPLKAPNVPDFVKVHFVDGLPSKVEVLDVKDQKKVTKTVEGSQKKGSLALYDLVNKLAGKHAIGRVDMVENRFIGIKSRGIYETPALTVLRIAHIDLEGICVDKEVSKVRDMLSSKFCTLVYNGFWFSPEMKLILSVLNQSQKNVTGWVKLMLYKGKAHVLARGSKYSLYNNELASFSMDGYDPKDAEGFIKTQAIRLKAYSLKYKNSYKLE